MIFEIGEIRLILEPLMECLDSFLRFFIVICYCGSAVYAALLSCADR